MIDRPCSGHPCDACRTCGLGRCCRRDNPSYRLPEVGTWQPVIGEIGVLATDGDKAECHICGRYFGRLGFHAVMAHDVTADEYRALFGLRRTTGLAGPRYAAKMAVLGKAHAGRLREMGAAAMSEMTTEQRSYWAQRKPTVQEARDRATRMREASARSMVCTVCGKAWVAYGYEQAERSTCGDQKCISVRIAAAQTKTGRYSRTAPRKAQCVVCGRTFAAGDRVTCSVVCRRERRRETMYLSDEERARRGEQVRHVSQRPEVRAKLSAAARRRIIDRGPDGRIIGWHHA